MPQTHTGRAALAALGLAASLVLIADVSLVATVTGLGGAGVVISAAAGRLGAAAGLLGAAVFGLFLPAVVELACGAVSRSRFCVGSHFSSSPTITQSPRWPSFIEQNFPPGPALPQILPMGFLTAGDFLAAAVFLAI